MKMDREGKRKEKREMTLKSIVNSKGEPQKTQVEIPIAGAGGKLGTQAVINLTKLISGLKNMKTGQEVITHYHIICGFATCCEMCGFLTEKSTNDIMHMVEHLVENELARVEEEGEDGQG